MSSAPLTALPIDLLRERTSTKWRTYPPEVIPMFVAEMDYPLAPAITRTLTRAIELGDTGYTAPDPGLRDAFAGFARRRWDWELDPAHLRSTGDVMMGVVEILRHVLDPGDRVIVMPPVYPPFFDCVPEAGCVVERVPLAREGSRWAIDLDGVEAALRDGARGVLLCNPHNPTGTVHSRESLAALAELAARHGAVVVSDEIHAPLAHDGHPFTPFLSASEEAASVGFAVTSASKTYNLPGLKCAVMIAGGEERAAALRSLPDEIEWRTGHLGALANVAAFSPESDEWLASLRAALRDNRSLLTTLLGEHLHEARYIEPDAGYLAWVNLSAYGWGDNPAPMIRREAGVALHHGPAFGEPGHGHVRINFACSPELLGEAIARIGALVAR